MPRLVRRSVTRLVVFLQVLLLVASLVAPVAALAEEPSGDPSPTPTPSAAPSAEPTPEPTAEPDPTAEPEPTAEPDPEPEPTAEPTPAATPEPTPEPATEPTATPAEPGAAAAPTIASDLEDYPPGGLVTLTGANWQSGESVHIYVNDDWGSTWNRHVNVVADAAGNIFDQFNLPAWFVAEYSVTATGEVSGVAVTSFTDSNPSAVIIGAPTSVSIPQGSTANYGVLTVAAGGNGSPCNTTLSIDAGFGTGLPAGAAPAFGINPVTTSGSDATTTFAVTTLASTPAGSYTFRVAGLDSEPSTGNACQGSNSNTPSGTLTLIVTAGSVSTTTTASDASATFGDASVTLSATVAPASGPAIGVGTVTFTVKDGAATIGTATSGTVTAGSATASFSLAGVDADTYTIEAAYSGGTGFNASNNSSQTPAPTLIVEKAPSETTVTCGAGPFAYDGDAHEPCTATVTGPGGLFESVAVGYIDNVNAGTATASSIFAESANHLGSNDSATFAIEQALLTITAADQAKTFGSTFVFDETDPSDDFTVSGLLNSDTVTGVSLASAGAPAAAGVAGSPYPIVVSDALGSGLDNYVISYVDGALTVDQAPSVTVVTCPLSEVYTGAAIEPCTVSVTGAGGLNLSPDPDYTDNVDAGTASASYTYAGDANHTGSSDSETFEIDQAPSVTVVTFESGPYVYRGSVFTATAVVTGAGGLNQPVTVIHSGDCLNVTVPDGCTASATYAGDANHTGSSDTKSITITKADPVIVVTPYSVIYDGNPHTATGSATGVLAEALVGLDLTGTTHTDAGTYDDDPWTFTDVTGNYNDASGTVDDVIDQAPSVTVVTCPVSVVYTGSLIQPCTVSVTGAGGLNLAPAPSYSNNLHVGTATASYTYAGDANHTGSSDSTTFEILTAFRIIGFDAPVDMTVVGNPRIYNSVKGGQTVPLKFRVFNLDGTEVTSTTGLGAWSRSVSCITGDVDPVLIPTVSTADNGLKRTGDRFHYNWAVPKAAGKCYQIFVQTVDGSTVMVGSLAGTPVLEAYFKSK